MRSALFLIVANNMELGLLLFLSLAYLGAVSYAQQASEIPLLQHARVLVYPKSIVRVHFEVLHTLFCYVYYPRTNPRTFWHNVI